jgi:hypothetical protein
MRLGKNPADDADCHNSNKATGTIQGNACLTIT